MRNPIRKSSLIHLLSLFLLAAGLGFSATGSGHLVDAKCYETLATNHNVSDSPVLQDVGAEVRFCSPKTRTHTFAIVRSDDVALALDSAGNRQAAQLVGQRARRAPLYVVVNGEIHDHAIAVNSISPVK
jgi:hypothetical protein